MLSTATKYSMIILTVCIAVGLTACGEHEQKHKLRSYVQKIKSRSAKAIEMIPSFKKPPKFTYAHSNRRSPFRPFIVKRDNNGLRPDENRQKQALEAFPIDSLRMVGILEENNNVWAIISAPDNAVYKIAQGQYIGQNYGKVVKITKQDINIKETILGQQGWEHRPASLILVE